MNSGKEKAAVGATAISNKQHSRAYLKAAPPSRENLKLQLGEILLYLQRPLNQVERQICWENFDLLLREYVSFSGGQRL